MDLSNFSRKWRDKNILITGGTGFVGKNMVPILESLGSYVAAYHSLEYDLRDREQTMLMFEGMKYDYIFHGAALQGAGDYTLKHPAEQISANSLIHINVTDAWKKLQPQARLIGFGSTCSYPGDMERLREEDYLTGKLHSSVQYYGLTKVLMQQAIEANKDQYGLKGTTLAFATLYGSMDDFDLSRAHVTSSLIRKFCDAKKSGVSQVEVWGDGTQLRELIYVEDQIAGILLTADHNGPILNIGSGIEISVREMAETIKRVSGYTGDIVYNTNRFVGVLKKVLDISKAKELYGWGEGKYSFTTLEDGLSKTIKWYEKQYGNTSN